MSKFFEWLKKAFGSAKTVFFRYGLDKFLSQYIDVAIGIVGKLALVNSNTAFHEWKDSAFQAVKDEIGKPIADNWIAILIGIAWENLKAKNTTGAIKL